MLDLEELRAMVGVGKGGGTGGGLTVIIQGDVLDGPSFERTLNKSRVEYDRRNGKAA